MVLLRRSNPTESRWSTMGAMSRCQETSVPVHPEGGGWYQDNLKQQACKNVVDAALLQKSLNAIAASEDVVFEEPKLPGMEEALPHHLLSDIINRVEDARDLANCMATSKSMKEAVSQVRALTLVCKKQYYDLARKRFPVRQCCCSDSEEEEEEEEEEEGEEADSEEDDNEEEHIESENDDEDDTESDNDECCEMSKEMSGCRNYVPPHCRAFLVHISFKNACLNMLHRVNNVEELRIEVDREMQGNVLLKEEIHMVDFWLSEPLFVRKWLSECYQSLKHLTLVDYGQQAIMRQSPILRILSENCPQLETLELRNMYLDTSSLLPLPHLHSLTLRCIKLPDHALSALHTSMPSLLTLALVRVFGLHSARLSSPHLRVLCLGLSFSSSPSPSPSHPTPPTATTIDLHLPNLHKLQLKMTTCPDSLLVDAPNLAYIAVCMEDAPLSSSQPSLISFHNVHHLRELLFGASHFATLSTLMSTNSSLEKLFLDVPGMVIGEDGKWEEEEGLVVEQQQEQEQGMVRVPDMGALKERCPLLHTLSVGPGMWHTMEKEMMEKKKEMMEKKMEMIEVEWPELTRLVVHVVVVELERCVAMVKWIGEKVPSLQVMEIYVHEESLVTGEEVRRRCEKEEENEGRGWGEKVQWGRWRRSLNFQCFSF